MSTNDLDLHDKNRNKNKNSIDKPDHVCPLNRRKRIKALWWELGQFEVLDRIIFYVKHHHHQQQMIAHIVIICVLSQCAFNFFFFFLFLRAFLIYILDTDERKKAKRNHNWWNKNKFKYVQRMVLDARTRCPHFIPFISSQRIDIYLALNGMVFVLLSIFVCSSPACLLARLLSFSVNFSSLPILMRTENRCALNSCIFAINLNNIMITVWRCTYKLFVCRRRRRRKKHGI